MSALIFNSKYYQKKWELVKNSKVSLLFFCSYGWRHFDSIIIQKIVAYFVLIEEICEIIRFLVK
jgi:hypothetical protein